METAPRSADPIDDTEPAPPTVRVYVPADEHGRRMLGSAVTCPPAGSLEGWTAIDVDAEAWESFDEARYARDRAEAQAKMARNAFEIAEERLAEEVDR